MINWKRMIRKIRTAPKKGTVPQWRIRKAVRAVNRNNANSKDERTARGSDLTQRSLSTVLRGNDVIAEEKS